MGSKQCRRMLGNLGFHILFTTDLAKLSEGWSSLQLQVLNWEFNLKLIKYFLHHKDEENKRDHWIESWKSFEVITTFIHFSKLHYIWRWNKDHRIKLGPKDRVTLRMTLLTPSSVSMTAVLRVWHWYSMIWSSWVAAMDMPLF
jgi:hypothetical protein